ncbi:MAG: thiamine ABC transporter substrate-binding protein [Candidatus Cloacimonetes bacterium]|nr:thiamine ABC transporter substrate-binding protein [Candidatus Cloacimonadota bacterium]
MFQRLSLCLLVCLSLFACGKADNKSKTDKSKYKHKLIIYCTDEFRKSGLEATVVPEFSQKYNCAVQLELYPTVASLCMAVKDPNNEGKFDLAIGIDNTFAASETIAVHFSSAHELNKESLSKESIFDTSLRLVPYAYSNLCLVYNKTILASPPESFGELQDAKYLNQIAVCDPHESGVGRATLFWSLALFGPDGYEHLWKSLRKNIYKSYPDRTEALEALKRGECNILISLNTIPAYLEELDPQSNTFDTSMLKEGSYQYIEAIGLHKYSPSASLAGKFMRHFLSPEAQKMVVYKLGMFPANAKTLLPMHFSTIPFTTYSVNSRLSQQLISEQVNIWLQFWDLLFGYQVY